MKNVYLIITLLLSVTLQAQHYYKDIVGTKDINDRMKSYNTARVQSVVSTGFDGQGTKTADFSEWQEVQDNGSVLKISTRNGQTVSRLYYQFDTNMRLVSSRDSTGDIQTVTTYNYDAKGNLIRIQRNTKDAQQDFNETEDRQWLYTAAGKPEKMWKIVNTSDSTEYRFNLDEQGNVADETMYRRGRGDNPVYYYYEDQRVYYYYDDLNRLSDIVRYNRKAKELLPDIMFEYDESNRVIQKITTVSTTTKDYFIWRYLFNDKGLKTKEALFNKSKQLNGRIDYTYTFLP